MQTLPCLNCLLQRKRRHKRK
ncbi:hypothetical protein CIB84_001035 [Bambusicola thoracicus]|uniref:Uncharacterized protein n=1 Tax=Bambusicola thoracicus TaxID=9083 RepID=A0A2P4TFR0_BAMTH|nr:hypothetical protein CIB84_001035 [Bambusicola thoracicus]